MDELQDLQNRFFRALARIESLNSAELGKDLAATRRENAQLLHKLDKVNTKRKQDRAELDSVLEQIRPILEGDQDA